MEEEKEEEEAECGMVCKTSFIQANLVSLRGTRLFGCCQDSLVTTW